MLAPRHRRHAGERLAQREWRTNVSLAGTRVPVVESTSEYQPAGDVFAGVAGELARVALTSLAADAA